MIYRNRETNTILMYLEISWHQTHRGIRHNPNMLRESNTIRDSNYEELI